MGGPLPNGDGILLRRQTLYVMNARFLTPVTPDSDYQVVRVGG